MKSTPYVVYALKDPRTDAVRYVGITAKTRLVRRVKEHLRRAASPKRKVHSARWLHSLLVVGLMPLVLILEHCPIAKAVSAETRWIRKLKRKGAALTNHTDTGTIVGYKLTPQDRAKLSKALTGRAKSAEHRQKLAAARRGKIASAATKLKMSKARLGVKRSNGFGAKISKIHFGRKRPTTAKAKMRLAWRARKADPAKFEAYREKLRRGWKRRRARTRLGL